MNARAGSAPPGTAAGTEEELVRPAYGLSTLAELLPGIGAHLGVPGCDDDPLRLPTGQRYVVVLVDGLGWHLVRRAAQDVPYFAELLGEGRPITAAVPSTTATSLASLGTGLPPGQHGIVGYTTRVPGTRELLNALTWESKVVPGAYQPRPTLFERAAEAGVEVATVALPRFADSGLTRAALRGGVFVPVEAEEDLQGRLDAIVAAAGRGSRSVVYVYERLLDHLGHGHGCGSAAWLAELRRIDGWCEQLREQLPDDVRLVITADHGMVDVPAGHQVIAEDEPGLLADVSAIAGEGRFRQVYVDHARPEAVAARWRRRLGERAWVRTRQEAIDDGWFGPVAPDIADRYGHVVVAAREDWAVMTRTVPRELTLVGMHGSLTAAEMLVPLFVD